MALSDLAGRLQLSDDETLAIFGLGALAAISGETAHRPEIAILDAITDDAARVLGDDALPRWLRAGPPGSRPLDLLLAGAFAAFEDALASRVALVA